MYDSAIEKGASACTELKEGGGHISATEGSKVEYLQLPAEHRLVGAIRPQVEAFRDGLGVFVTTELRAKLRQCATVAELQLLICGVQEMTHTQHIVMAYIVMCKR